VIVSLLGNSKYGKSIFVKLNIFGLSKIELTSPESVYTVFIFSAAEIEDFDEVISITFSKSLLHEIKTKRVIIKLIFFKSIA
jgi:hypothetical protein